MNNHPIGCEAFVILRYYLAESFPEILAQSCGFLGLPTNDPFRERRMSQKTLDPFQRRVAAGMLSVYDAQQFGQITFAQQHQS
jgi:hypothetical protein